RGGPGPGHGSAGRAFGREGHVPAEAREAGPDAPAKARRHRPLARRPNGQRPQEEELIQSFAEDDPVVRLLDKADRYLGGAIVEDLHGFFEVAEINGGSGRNIMVVNDADGTIIVGSTPVLVTPWTGRDRKSVVRERVGRE